MLPLAADPDLQADSVLHLEADPDLQAGSELPLEADLIVINYHMGLYIFYVIRIN